ncbi:MAG: hypothetical protein AAGB93_17330 [Planctomycetota bacterium]
MTTALGHRRLLHVLVSTALAAAAAQEARADWELRAVDDAGRPVAGVALEFVQSAAETGGGARALGGASRFTTDDEGRIGGEGDTPFALDVVSLDPAWSVAFLHTDRAPELDIDEVEREDLLGRPLLRLDLERPGLCVLAPTGTIRIRVVGAKAGDRFHACFVDDRPEPASHRTARSSTTFDGASGTLVAPAGRGNLYVAREGALGAPVVANGRPLLVSVVGGGTSEVELRFVDGPTTTLVAPFGVLPFRRVKALTPDGATVVADLAFESSPLRIPSSIAVTTDTEVDAPLAIAARLQKHLVRGEEIPGSDALDPARGAAQDAPRPEVETAPAELLFTVDVGAKVRFPELETGWEIFARSGLSVLAGAGSVGGFRGDVRSAPGSLVIGALPEGIGDRASPDGPWTAQVTLTAGPGGSGGFREVLVSVGGIPPIRSAADSDGRLRIDGIPSGSILVASLVAPFDRVVVEQPRNDAVPEATLRVSTRRRTVRGTWTDADGNRPKRGAVVALVPSDPEEAAQRYGLGTRAFPLAITDANGTFDFGPVPCGAYMLQTDLSSAHELSVPAADDGSRPDPIVVRLRGLEGTPELEVVR